jgi:biotin carboxyl carrier protein
MKREFTLDIDGQQITVTAAREGDAITVSRDGRDYTVRILAESVAGVQASSHQPTGGSSVKAAASLTSRRPAPAASAPPQPAPSPVSGGPGAVNSPMTGVIDQVLVADGAVVAEGDTILVLEAMKMYIDVMAPAAGTVSGVSIKAGDSVKEGQLLLTIDVAGGEG